MRIGNTILDTDYMSVTEITELIKKLRTIRDRKCHAANYLHGLEDLVHEAKTEGYVFCSKHTGEVFHSDDWDLYDEQLELTHSDEVRE